MKKAWNITRTLFWIATIPLFLLFCNLAGQKVGEFITERIKDIWDLDILDDVDDVLDKITDVAEDIADAEEI